MKDNMTPMAHGLGDEVKGTHDATYTCEPTADLAKGTATHGMTLNGMGGLTAADIEAGFSDGEYNPPPPPTDGTIANPIMDLIDAEDTGGFLHRDHGWAR